MEKATAQAFYADLKALVTAEGRAADQVLILPGLSPMIAGTQAEAERLAQEVNELADPEVGRKRLSGRFGGHDFSHLPLDRPLVPEDFPPPSAVEAARTQQPTFGQRMVRVEHAQLVHPDDVPRFARLGVVASMQPIHAIADWRAADRRASTRPASESSGG